MKPVNNFPGAFIRRNCWQVFSLYYTDGVVEIAEKCKLPVGIKIKYDLIFISLPKITMNIKICFFVVLCFTSVFSGSNNSALSQVMHPQRQIDFVKNQIKNQQAPYWEAYQELLAYADTALNSEHHALIDFNVPRFYVDPDAHRNNSKSLQT